MFTFDGKQVLVSDAYRVLVPVSRTMVRDVTFEDGSVTEGVCPDDIMYEGPCALCGKGYLKAPLSLPKANICDACLRAFADAASQTTPVVVGAWEGALPRNWASPQRRGGMTRRFNAARREHDVYGE